MSSYWLLISIVLSPYNGEVSHYIIHNYEERAACIETAEFLTKLNKSYKVKSQEYVCLENPYSYSSKGE